MTIERDIDEIVAWEGSSWVLTTIIPSAARFDELTQMDNHQQARSIEIYAAEKAGYEIVRGWPKLPRQTEVFSRRMRETYRMLCLRYAQKIAELERAR